MRLMGMIMIFVAFTGIFFIKIFLCTGRHKLVVQAVSHRRSSNLEILKIGRPIIGIQGRNWKFLFL